jgi:guanylate kinase
MPHFFPGYGDTLPNQVNQQGLHELPQVAIERKERNAATARVLRHMRFSRAQFIHYFRHDTSRPCILSRFSDGQLLHILNDDLHAPTFKRAPNSICTKCGSPISCRIFLKTKIYSLCCGKALSKLLNFTVGGAARRKQSGGQPAGLHARTRNLQINTDIGGVFVFKFIGFCANFRQKASPHTEIDNGHSISRLSDAASQGYLERCDLHVPLCFKRLPLLRGKEPATAARESCLQGLALPMPRGIELSPLTPKIRDNRDCSMPRLDPSRLVPTSTIRDIDNERLNFWISGIKNNRFGSPIKCAEHNGSLYIVDGHHRWAAFAILAESDECEVDILTEESLKNDFGMTPGQLARQTRYLNRYDWEQLVGFPVQCLPCVEPTALKKFCVLAGPSGAGKSTLISELIRTQKEFKFTTSVTTRQQRPSEINGQHYHFISTARFLEMVTEGLFAEWQYVHGNHYGSLTEDVLHTGGQTGITDLDILGALLLKTMFPDRVCLFFVDAADVKILQKRLAQRDGLTEDFYRRISRIGMEKRFARLFDGVIINHNTELAVDDLYNSIARQQQADRDAGQHEFIRYEIWYGDKRIKWANSVNRIDPTLYLKLGNITVNESFELLDYIIYNQIVDDLRGVDRSRLLAKEIHLLGATAPIEAVETEIGLVHVRKIRLGNSYAGVVEQFRIFALE